MCFSYIKKFEKHTFVCYYRVITEILQAFSDINIMCFFSGIRRI